MPPSLLTLSTEKNKNIKEGHRERQAEKKTTHQLSLLKLFLQAEDSSKKHLYNKKKNITNESIDTNFQTYFMQNNKS